MILLRLFTTKTRKEIFYYRLNDLKRDKLNEVELFSKPNKVNGKESVPPRIKTQKEVFFCLFSDT